MPTTRIASGVGVLRRSGSDASTLSLWSLESVVTLLILLERRDVELSQGVAINMRTYADGLRLVLGEPWSRGLFERPQLLSSPGALAIAPFHCVVS